MQIYWTEWSGKRNSGTEESEAEAIRLLELEVTKTEEQYSTKMETPVQKPTVQVG
jgi:hypothetical protein